MSIQQRNAPVLLTRADAGEQTERQGVGILEK